MKKVREAFYTKEMKIGMEVSCRKNIVTSPLHGTIANWFDSCADPFVHLLPVRALSVVKSYEQSSNPAAFTHIKPKWLMGSGCGTVDSTVASNTRGPRFESNLWQLLLNNYLQLTVCRKDENNENSGREGILKNSLKWLMKKIPNIIVVNSCVCWRLPEMIFWGLKNW